VLSGITGHSNEKAQVRVLVLAGRCSMVEQRTFNPSTATGVQTCKNAPHTLTEAASMRRCKACRS
jgi:hypothetical protein